MRSLKETAKRHKRCKRPKPSIAFAFYGIDGSGKSTLSRMVAKKLSDAFRVCLVSDNLEFYENENQKEQQKFFHVWLL